MGRSSCCRPEPLQPNSRLGPADRGEQTLFSRPWPARGKSGKPGPRPSGGLLEARALQNQYLPNPSLSQLPAFNRFPEEIRNCPPGRVPGGFDSDSAGTLFDGGLPAVPAQTVARSNVQNGQAGRQLKQRLQNPQAGVRHPLATLCNFAAWPIGKCEARNQKLTGRSYRRRSR